MRILDKPITENKIVSNLLIVGCLLLLALPLATAGIIGSIEAKINGIIITMFGFAMLSIGTGVGGKTHIKTGIIGAFVFIVGLGMIGGASFWDSFSRLWNWMK